MGKTNPKERIAQIRRSARARRLGARAPRYALAGCVAIVLAVGLREILAPADATVASRARPQVDRAAESYALELARAYLTYDAAHPQERERRLRRLVPGEIAPDAGFLPRSGSREVLWAQVAQTRQAAFGEQVIVVAAGTDADPRPVYLSLRVARSRGGALRLTAYPALVGPPAVSRAELPEREEVADPELAAVARRAVANYLAGERANLAADLLAGAEVSLPTVGLTLRSVERIAWAEGPGSGAVLATVVAAGPRGATYTLSYELGIERRRGRPYVSFVETVPMSP